MILCGLTGIGQGLPGGSGYVLDHGHPRHIDAVAARYPDAQGARRASCLSVAGRNAGDPDPQAQRHYELHGWGPKQFSPALKKAIAGRMQDRIMFGCDFPVLRYEKVLQDWRAEGYSQDVLEKVHIRERREILRDRHVAFNHGRA